MPSGPFGYWHSRPELFPIMLGNTKRSWLDLFPHSIPCPTNVPLVSCPGSPCIA